MTVYLTEEELAQVADDADALPDPYLDPDWDGNQDPDGDDHDDA